MPSRTWLARRAILLGSLILMMQDGETITTMTVAEFTAAPKAATR